MKAKHTLADWRQSLPSCVLALMWLHYASILDLKLHHLRLALHPPLPALLTYLCSNDDDPCGTLRRLFCRLMDPEGPGLRRMYTNTLEALKLELAR